ncbi:unnamed protein product [Linum trigynum]|uniref:Uncharacterized protein n=1 Tax=Linum trigynum TaxID=586398 RepID=A0AAV2DC51_9ROSI
MAACRRAIKAYDRVTAPPPQLEVVDSKEVEEKDTIDVVNKEEDITSLNVPSVQAIVPVTELSLQEPVFVDICINDTIATPPKANVQLRIDSAYQRVSSDSQTMEQGLTSVVVQVDVESPLFSMTGVANLSIASEVALSIASNSNKIAYRAGEMIPREAGLKDGKERQIIPIQVGVSWKFRRKRKLEDGGQEHNVEEGNREDTGFGKMAVAGLGVKD